ncbi:MAG: DUF4215 domain-containing protein [Candidatus Micrarchaeota archaeon]
MGGFDSRLLPAVLVLTFSLLLFFGCIMQPAGGASPTDEFGQKVEALNSRVAAASTASGISGLSAEVSALEVAAKNDSTYSKYIPLLEAQNLTLDVLSVYLEFQSEGASLGTSGVDCSKNYSAFIAKLRSANSTANSAISKARSYLSSNPNSSANLLVSAVNETDPEGMAVYAEMLESEIQLNCPEAKSPAKTYALPLSREDAIALMVDEVVGQNDYYAYAPSASPLPAGTVVTSTRGDAEFNHTLPSATWFFFVDTDPFAPFEHDTFFVYVDVATADFTVTNESYFPVINGISYFASMDSRLDSSWRIYPDASEGNLTINLTGPVTTRLNYYALAIASPPQGTPVPLADAECCKGVGKKYALIMSGYDDPVFDADTQNTYEYLKGQGYSDGDITYLTTQGGEPNSDGQTTLSSVKSAFEGLISKADCCDKVFIYLAGHGKSAVYYQYRNKKTGETSWASSSMGLTGGAANWRYTGVSKKLHRITVNPRFSEALPDGSVASHGSPEGGRMVDAQFDAYLDRMKSCDITIMYLSCYSGVASGNIKGPGRTVITPVGDNPAYGATRTVDGYQAGGFFTQNFIKAKTDATAKNAADKNGDQQVSDKEAFDWAKDKTKDFVRDRLGKDNTATWTGPERCRCCHVICDANSDYLCKAVAGNGTDSPDCSFIGDYCGPRTPPPQPPANETPLTGNGTAGNGTSGNGTGEQPPTDAISPVCGDGKITGNEGCDYGSTNTNKCSEGYYCHDSCVCKKLETTVVCGDGKISVPNEDCDGGNVKFKVCPSGYTCSICKCKPTQAQCGDGTVTPPEECDHGNSYTDDCPDGKVCSGCKCYAPGDVPPDEAYCGNNDREGAEECDGTDDSACASDEYCSGCACVAEAECGDGDVEGNEECEDDNDCSGDDVCSNCMCVAPGAECGNDEVESGEECEDDEDCDEGETCDDCMCWQTPTYCGDGTVNGNEQCDPDATPTGCSEPALCGSNCQCVSPPSLNCDYVCSLTSGTQVIGSGYSSQSQCQSAASSFFTSRTCYTTCKYSWFYRVDNIAGYASCCCGVKKEFACSDCPGPNPVCPPAESICPANAPNWQSPP